MENRFSGGSSNRRSVSPATVAVAEPGAFRMSVILALK
jgi:hypothetical protein